MQLKRVARLQVTRVEGKYLVLVSYLKFMSSRRRPFFVFCNSGNTELLRELFSEGRRRRRRARCNPDIVLYCIVF